MMWDRRVLRGNTYAAQIPTSNQQEQARVSRIQDAARTKRMREKEEVERQNREQALEDKLRAVAGRAHMEIQTDDYLEDLDDAVFEQEFGTQTDFPEAVPEPELYPHPYKMNGESKATCIEGKEIFDFDISVQPILQTLMGQCMDFGLSEVLEEQELKELRKYQKDFTAEKQTKEEKIREVESLAKQAFADKQAHVDKERARLRQEHEVARKITSNHKAREFLGNLQNHVFDELHQGGFFFDPQDNAVQTQFLPWVLSDVASRLQSMGQATNTTESLINSSLQAITQERVDLEDAKREVIRRRREEKTRIEAEEVARKLKVEEDAAAALRAQQEAEAAANAAEENEGGEKDDGGEDEGED